MGYANKVIKLDFSAELSGDPENDRIFVIIRNPRLMPQKEIAASDTPGAYDDNGKVADKALAEEAVNKLIAKLTVAARAYDATWEPEYDSQTGEPVGDGEAPLLPHAPWGPEVAAKLPLAIRLRIAEEFSEALNPRKDPMPKMSSSS